MTKKLKRLLAGILSICVSASLGIFAVACNNTPDNGDEGGNPPIGDEGNNPGGDEENPGGDEENPGGDEEPTTSYTITLNANGGTVGGLSEIKLFGAANDSIELPNPDEKGGLYVRRLVCERRNDGRQNYDGYRYDDAVCQMDAD